MFTSARARRAATARSALARHAALARSIALATAAVAMLGVPSVTSAVSPNPSSVGSGSGTGAWLVTFKSNVSHGEAAMVANNDGASQVGDLADINTEGAQKVADGVRDF